MSRLIPTALFLVLLCVLGGSILLLGSGPEVLWTLRETPKTEVSYSDIQKTTNDDAEEDATKYTTAIQEKKLELCDTIKNTEKKQECKNMIVAGQALQEKDIELCATLTNTGIRERCHDNITYFIAEDSRNVSDCEKIQDQTIRKNCIGTIQQGELEDKLASGSLDITFCDTIFDSTLKTDCARKISTERDSAFYREAIASKSLSQCDEIADSVIKVKCRDTVYFDMAITDGNLDYCTEVVDSERSEYCRKSLLSRQDIMRYQQVIRTGDLEACKSLSVIQMRNQCHDTIIFAQVREKMDDSYCDLLYNTGITAQCHDMIKGAKK